LGKICGFYRQQRQYLIGDFSEIEATIDRYAMHAATMINGAALLSDLGEYLPERWPCLIGYFNVEVAKYEAASSAENQG
jgi:hypothetical protein